jgi:hypothetical protein
MKDLSRVGERRFQCAFKACYCLYEVSAIQITHHNDTNLPPEDCLSEEDNSITFVVIVLSLPACVSRLPQRQPLQDIPSDVSQCRQADHGHSAQNPRHLFRIGAPCATSTRCGNLPLGFERLKDSFSRKLWRLVGLRKAKHFGRPAPQISGSKWATGIR